jgi:hypothetical protein
MIRGYALAGLRDALAAHGITTVTPSGRCHLGCVVACAFVADSQR